MPLLKSSKKALRGSRRKQARNILQTRRLREALRRADAKTINQTISLIDKAAKNHLIHPNKAARLKSRLAKKIGSTPKAEGGKAEMQKSIKAKMPNSPKSVASKTKKETPTK